MLLFPIWDSQSILLSKPIQNLHMKKLLCFFLTLSAAIHAQPFPIIRIVDQNRQPIPNVVVNIPDTQAANTAPPLSAVVDQVDRQFVPHVSVVRTNTLIDFPNSDNTRHHVYSFSPAKKFELKLYRKSEAPPIKFDQPGIVTLGCNIHDNMVGYIFITDSHIYGISNDQGHVNLPAYTGMAPQKITLWHPKLGENNIIEKNNLAELLALPSTVIELPFVYKAVPETKKKTSLRDRLKKFKTDYD